ncbi:MAG: hypothetical protein RL662_48 [Bacteroidota bacterium]|jgi:23S rRNA pseudouridine1911/1915/1917 synthase
MKEKTKNTVLQELKVIEKAELLEFLMAQNVRKSRNATKSLLVHKQVKVNNSIVSLHNHPLVSGDKVTIHKHDTKMDQKKLNGLTIVYEDKDLIVVDKESGLLSVSTGKEALKETAYNIINNYIKTKNAKAKAYILYRIDRETSGLMVFAKSEDIQEDLQKKWILHPPKRSYQAIVEGKIVPPKGSITSWLTENKNFVMFSSPNENGGLKSTTHYKTIQANNRYSLLRIDLETARKNQIRVQLQSIGHPIVGDKKYGSKTSPIRRIALHADELSFIHPTTKEKLELKSPLPKKMQIIADSILYKVEANPQKKEIEGQ